MNVHHVCPGGQEGESNTELDLQAFVRSMRVPGTELGSSARATCALNY